MNSSLEELVFNLNGSHNHRFVLEDSDSGHRVSSLKKVHEVPLQLVQFSLRIEEITLGVCLGVSFLIAS